MSGNILWKTGITAFILLWAVSNIIPPHDTPFPRYLRENVEARQEDFADLLRRAEKRAEQGEAPTVYVALKNIAKEDRVDLSEFFSGIHVQDIRNLDKRNDKLMRELLRRSQGKIKLGLDLKGGVAFTFAVNEEDLEGEKHARQQQIADAKDIIAERVDGLGVAEPVIRLKGENRIEVQMPGISARSNPEVTETLQAPARLEFRLVKRSPKPGEIEADDYPRGYEVLTEEKETETGEIVLERHFVKKLPEASGEIIERADPSYNEYGGAVVSFTLTDEGGERFAKLTRKLAEKREKGEDFELLGTVLDGRLESVAVVQSEIQKHGQITGNFTQREAFELANVLNNPLEVGLRIEEMNEIGPLLAKDARGASITAGLLGASLVILFMLAYYGLAGAVAVAAVALNVVLVVGTLSSFEATLTLPGVAALVLTIGMAVDANILIFERIREELKTGKKLLAAVTSGYDKAISTIVDANVTTLITAVILIWLGTGPVKGFGVTLTIGIFATLFCSLAVSRWLLEWLVEKNLIAKMLRFQLFSEPGWTYLDYAKKAFTGSWALVVLGIIFLGLEAHKGTIFGIDFTGGEELTLTYQKKITSRQVAAAAEERGFGEVNTLYQTPVGQEQELMKIQTELGKGEAFFKVLKEAYPDAGLDLTGIAKIGAAVGSEVKWSAIESLLVALAGILLYIAVRFEFGYGVGAVVATIHDMFMTAGLFVVLGFFGIGSGQFTAPMIAAILMTVGYSINDTIVVFDRVREELDLNPGTDLRQVIHLAINRVLSRTILTSVTTFLATLALVLFGAGVITDFALVFMLGILTGTFSSIFVASPVFYWYHKGDRRKVEEHHILPAYEWEAAGGKTK